MTSYLIWFVKEAYPEGGDVMSAVKTGSVEVATTVLGYHDELKSALTSTEVKVRQYRVLKTEEYIQDIHYCINCVPNYEYHPAVHI